MVKKTTTRTKTTTRSSAGAKTAPKPAAAKAGAAGAVEVKALGKRGLIERVVETSGIKKKSAKPVVEAVLKELGEALSRGDRLNLQPFGKAFVKNRKEVANAEVFELRLRRSKQAMAGGPAPAGPLAEAAE